MTKGKIIVLCGPSGVGKNTLVDHVVDTHENIVYSISATTRAPRKGEVHGDPYFFLSEEQFLKLIEEDGLIEYAKYDKNYYGTPRKAVEDTLAAGRYVIMEIELQGAKNVRRLYEDAILIYIMPPSLKELKNRLILRGDPMERVERRMQETERELREVFAFDYILVNDDLTKAKQDLDAILRADALSYTNMKKTIDEVIEYA